MSRNLVVCYFGARREERTLGILTGLKAWTLGLRAGILDPGRGRMVGNLPGKNSLGRDQEALPEASELCHPRSGEEWTRSLLGTWDL